MAEWWDGIAGERYWCEITDRGDLGVDLHAPQTNSAGRDYWSYSLITQVRAGDFVFHYSTRERAIVGASVATGDWYEAPVVWQAHGTVGRSEPARAEPQPGWWLRLEKFHKASVPLTLASLREQREEDWIRAWIAAKESEPGVSSAKAPFQRYGPGLRAAQGYLTKMPSEFVARWPTLRYLAAEFDDDSAVLVEAEETERQAAATSDPAAPEIISGPLEALLMSRYEVRRTGESAAAERREQELVIAYGEFLVEQGREVRRHVYRVGPLRLACDLFDETQRVLYEAKGTVIRNAIRMAIGQLFDYRRLEQREVQMAMLLPVRPADDVLALAASLGIGVVWREGVRFRSSLFGMAGGIGETR